MDTFRDTPAEAQELADRLAADGVRWVVGSYVDVNGCARGKVVPVDHLPQLLAGSERYTPRGLDGVGGMDPVEPECITLPDLDTLRVLPWDRSCAHLFADLSQEGVPYALCPRSTLKAQLAEAESMGLRFLLGVETEMYVFKADALPALEPVWPSGAYDPSPAYLVSSALDAKEFLGPMVETLQELDFGVFSFDHEGGAGQYEFDFAHDGALEMADKVTRFRLAARAHAERVGGVASFMPKPSEEHWGSGAHFNMSLESAATGENLFRAPAEEEGGPPGWTPLARSFAAGVLRHAAALSAVSNPTVNSYKRLVGRLADGGTSWAPIWATAGDNNRSCMLRFPHNRPALENRAVDASANVYFAAALTLAAGLEGIREELDLGPFVEGAAYAIEEGVENRGQRLPETLLDAVRAFEDDALVRKVFPADLVDTYAASKRDEWRRFHEQVSEWERTYYLQRF
jgi:glutamine synthetase